MNDLVKHNKHVSQYVTGFPLRSWIGRQQQKYLNITVKLPTEHKVISYEVLIWF